MAASLFNAGAAWHRTGCTQEALTATSEAVDIIRRESRKDPLRYEDIFVTAVDSLVRILIDLDRKDEAILHIETLIALYRTRRDRNGSPEATEGSLQVEQRRNDLSNLQAKL
ncbi:hypothetical protein ACQP2X_31095 [Actinoplanes sp. CA-131856]